MATNKLIDLSRLSRFWDKAKDYISNEVSSKQDDMSGGSIRNVDLNDLIETKTYWVNNDNILNAPTNTYGYLEVFAQGSSLRLQRWTTFGSYDVYERYYVNSQWYSWKKISANDIIDKIYPIGSIYMSVTDSTVASVQARFGGTWERISEGKALFGYSTTDTDFQTIGSGGGNKTVNLQHSHTVDSHTHTLPANTGGTKLTSAQSGVPHHTHGLNGHKHSYSKVNSATEGYTLKVADIPSHNHTATLAGTSSMAAVAGSASALAAAGGSFYVPYSTVQNIIIGNTGSGGSHSHSIKTTSTATGGASPADTANNTASDASSAHSHTITGPTGNASPATDNQLSTTQSVLNPYITVYMYKRTA